MDILQNSTRAKATRIEITILEDTQKDIYFIEIVDNGCGMDKETIVKAFDPFFTTRTVRKVGMGLSLLQQNAEKAGGEMELISALNEGTTVRVIFSHKHIDRPVLGDIAGTIVLTASANPHIHFRYIHQKDGNDFIFDTNDINEALDGVSIQEPLIIDVLRGMIIQNLTDIGVEF
jgi:hypothetical protein